ncbi:MAG: metal-dependent transcriptional regulator [Methanomicrobiaceae archaeon]|nr:metal-dependent transcriptional regulator [Methanomicrobiaceae archaeon]
MHRGCVKNLSRKAEDYLEAILNVILTKGYAKTKDVAAELGVRSPSVVEMFRKLDKMGLVEYRRYEGVVLTAQGREIAEAIRFRHETLKRLFTLIGVPEDIADADACMMEHELSEKSVRQIRLFIDFLASRPVYETMEKDFSRFCTAGKNENSSS